MNQVKAFRFAIASIAAGACLIASSIWNSKRRRQVMDTATSKVATAALGHTVELQGKVYCHPDELIISPFTRKKCANYKLDVWVKEGKYYEFKKTFWNRPFMYLIDESQEVAAIDLSNSDVHDDSDGEIFYFGLFNHIPKDKHEFLIENKVLETDDVDYKIVETVFMTSNVLYGIGYAKLMPEKEGPLKLSSKVRIGRNYQIQNPNHEVSRFILTASPSKDSVIDVSKVFVTKQTEKQYIKSTGGKVILSFVAGTILLILGCLLILGK